MSPRCGRVLRIFAAERIGVAAGERDDFITLVEHAPCADHHLLAHFGELYVLRLALDQLHAQILFEFLQLCGQGRLAHECPLGRLAEMPGIGQRHQVLQILEIHTLTPIEVVYQDHHYNPFH